MLGRHHPGVIPLWTAVLVLTGIFCPSTRAADKKEKVEPWFEIRTAHFVVASDGGEKTARRVADQFELIRRVFQATMPNARLDTGLPIYILAARDNKSFSTLFPEIPYDKNTVPTAGLFLLGSEKTYIALRMNAFGRTPYEEIYQNYARMVLKMSYHSLPPWLEEGYANMYGSMKLSDKGVSFDRPDPEDLSVLYESPLLPLDLVLHVDRGSAYYTSGNKMTVYFAESRAFVHYLLTDPQWTGAKSLDRYVALVENGADSLQATRQVFGDLNQLQTRLNSYIKQSAATPSEITAPSGSEVVSSARTLSPAETEARMGDFELTRGMRDDARTKLEDALKLDPSLASAEESLGFLLLQLEQYEEAEKHFSRAVELDPKDSLAYYGQGMIAMSRGGYVGVPVGAVVAFEKTVALSPDFAPAWFNLASIYGLRKDALEKALVAAQRAASLVPGDSGYQYQVAVILENLGRTEEARKAAEQLRSSSKDTPMADKAGDLLARISQPRGAPPASKNGAKPAAPTERAVQVEQQAVPEDKTATAISKSEPTGNNLPAPSPAPAETHIYSMVGTITEVSCVDAPQIQITLKAESIVMHLHAADLAQVTIKPSGTATLAKNAVCTGLRGRSARVSYQLVSDKKWDAEMQTVELRSAP